VNEITKVTKTTQLIQFACHSSDNPSLALLDILGQSLVFNLQMRVRPRKYWESGQQAAEGDNKAW
jgi:hypothetical protein